jgi:hypothetical protein
MFFTDGLLERDTASVDIETWSTARRCIHAKPPARHSSHPRSDRRALKDDATALSIDWHGRSAREWTSNSGRSNDVQPDSACGYTGSRAGSVLTRSTSRASRASVSA